MKEYKPAKIARLVEAKNGQRQVRSPWIDLIALADEDAPEHDWVIPDLLERQGRIILAGSEGSGKSLLALTLGVQAAAGLPVLDCFPAAEARRVVFFDLEMGRSSIRRRSNQLRLSARPHLEDGAITLYHYPDGLDLANKDQVEDILWKLRRLQPDLLVFDPLYKMMVTDSRYERESKPTIKFLDELRAEHNAGILLIHHLRKRLGGETERGRDTSDMFGSAVLLWWPETLMLLREDSLKVAKDREDYFGPTKLFPVRRGGKWPISLGMPKENLRGEAIYERVRLLGPIAANTLYGQMGGNRNRFYEALGELERTGRIVKENDKWVVPRA